MAQLLCGARIRYGNYEPGTSGCLVRFLDMPNRVLMLAAGHVVLPTFAQKNDAINALDLPDAVFGRLLTWTTFDGDPTADAALIWVDPSLASPLVVGIGAPRGVNKSPQVGDTLTIIPHAGQAACRETKITQLNADVSVLTAGPNWSDTLSYSGQILCSPMISEPGDSGAIAVDQYNRVVGMVVAGSDSQNNTLVTPIAAILTNAAWQGGELEVLSKIPDNAVGPPIPASMPTAVAAVDLSSLTQSQRAMAQMILDSFEAAGFGLYQRVAAIANAKQESALNPMEVSNPPEHSVGLFQLNMTKGLGKGYTQIQLQDPATNIQIILAECLKYPAFGAATDLVTANSEFVSKIERPADIPGETARRLTIAQGFLS